MGHRSTAALSTSRGLIMRVAALYFLMIAGAFVASDARADLSGRVSRIE